MRFPDAVLIDLDDTIIDDSSCVESCWTDAVSEAVRHLDGVVASDLRAAIDRRTTWYWSDAERHRIGRLDLRTCTRKIVAGAYADLKIDDEVVAHQTAERYRDLREERARLFPGALEALERLRAGGCRLGLMTNGAGPSQRAKLDRFGLTGYFDHLLIEGEFGTGKPDESVYLSLLNALQVQPGNAWAIGDNLDFDVFPPMSLGIFGVWVKRNGLAPASGRAPDRVVSSLRDLIH